MFAFQANGDEVATRFTTAGETNFVFGEFLAPLEPYRQDLLILNKLDKKFGKLPAGSVADNHEQGGSALAPWPSGTGSYPIGGTDTTIGFVLGPSADRSIGDMVLAANPSIPHRHLVYRVGGKRNDIWNLHSHAGPVGTQNPIPPETDPYAAYARIFMFNATDAAAQAAIQKRLLKKQSALDLVLAEANTLSSKVGTKDRAEAGSAHDVAARHRAHAAGHDRHAGPGDGLQARHPRHAPSIPTPTRITSSSASCSSRSRRWRSRAI